MTNASHGDGPAKVVMMWKDAEGYVFQKVVVVGKELIEAANSNNTRPEEIAKAINKGLMPILLAENEMVNALNAVNDWLKEAWTSDKPIHPYTHRILAEKVTFALAAWKEAGNGITEC